MQFSVTSSNTVVQSAEGFPQVGVPGTPISIYHKVTVNNGETLTYKHFRDELLIRSVEVYNPTNGQIITSGITVNKSNKEQTTVTFATGGTYLVVIKNNL